MVRAYAGSFQRGSTCRFAFPQTHDASMPYLEDEDGNLYGHESEPAVKKRKSSSEDDLFSEPFGGVEDDAKEQEEKEEERK